MLRGKTVIKKINGNIVLSLDPNRSKTELLEAVKAAIEMLCKPNRERTKPHQVDKWHVYDLYQKTPVLQQVARQVFDYKVNQKFEPACNEKHSSQYKQVERAYHKACQIIKRVEKLASKPA